MNLALLFTETAEVFAEGTDPNDLESRDTWTATGTIPVRLGKPRSKLVTDASGERLVQTWPVIAPAEADIASGNALRILGKSYTLHNVRPSKDIAGRVHHLEAELLEKREPLP